MPCLTAYPGVAAYLPGANARERCELLSVSDTTNRCYLLRVLTGDVSCITWSRLGEERG